MATEVSAQERRTSAAARLARRSTRPLLAGVLGVAALIGLVVVFFFLVPPPYLQVPDLQPVARVAHVADVPVGTSRMVTWGTRSVLVIRRDETTFFAVQGTGSSDGCFLRWNQDALRIESPCTYVVYDLDGNVVEGLTRIPLRRYRVFERAGTLYVTES
jgi:nitrite reductase/ring-hydroxylating ferredoxin subunit